MKANDKIALNLTVSIITVVYNNVNTISDAIESVINQDYKDIEYIIIDGYSNDGTLDILKKYKSCFSTFISEPDNGIYDAMNKGLEHVTGEVIGFLNADDLLASEDCISKIVETFNEHNADVVYGDNLYVDREDLDKVIRTWEAGRYKRELFRKGWMPPHIATYIRKDLYNKYGNFDTDYQISGDYDLMFRFMYLKKAEAVHIPKVISKMRLGGVSNGSLGVVIKTSIEVYECWKKYDQHISPIIMLRKPLSKVKQYFKAWF